MPQSILAACQYGDVHGAEQLLRAAVAEQRRRVDALILGDARMLLAYSELRARRPSAALAAIVEALDDHVSRGTPGLLLLAGVPIAVPLLRLARAHRMHLATTAPLLRARES